MTGMSPERIGVSTHHSDRDTLAKKGCYYCDYYSFSLYIVARHVMFLPFCPLCCCEGSSTIVHLRQFHERLAELSRIVVRSWRQHCTLPTWTRCQHQYQYQYQCPDEVLSPCQSLWLIRSRCPLWPSWMSADHLSKTWTCRSHTQLDYQDYTPGWPHRQLQLTWWRTCRQFPCYLCIDIIPLYI